MLSIKTDIKNLSWLKYIVSQFKKINLANFDIEIIEIDTKETYENVIFYSSNPQADFVSIYNSNELMLMEDIEYLDDNVYILKNTKNELFDFKYDIFWNTFVFLSRYEEYVSEKNGKNIYSYLINHPRVNKKSFEVPIVNILFNELEDFLKSKFTTLNFGEKQNPIIDLSHDVDYINKTVQLRLKQTAFNGFNMIKSITKPKKLLSRLQQMIKFAFSNPSYWCFEYWVKLEKRYNKRSTFYIYVKNGKKSLKSWLIDPSYDIQTNIRLQNELKKMYSDGFEIGLHGSYESAINVQKLKEEKDILEQSLGIKITKTRQHWLNYFEQVTPKIHEELFEYDSTVGWNDKMGFRSGCASLYQPYDFEKEKAFNYSVIPQIVMDSHLYDYATKNDKESIIFAKNIIKSAIKYSKTTYVSVSWHQRVCSCDYSWDIAYKELLDDL